MLCLILNILKWVKGWIRRCRMTKVELEKFTATGDTTIVEAMKKIDMNSYQVLFVVDGKGCLLGSVSDGDIRRALIKNGQLDQKIAKLMNTKTQYICEGETWDENYWKEHVGISVVPVVNSNNVIIDFKRKLKRNIISEEQKKYLRGVPVVIMAGGKGTRLYPFTKILPKPLIPVGDTPILERVLNQYAAYGIHQFYLTVNYKRNIIKSYFDDLDKTYQLKYVEEDQPLGTGGSLRLITDSLEKPMVVANCDILIEADYADIYRYHLESKSDVTIVSALKQIQVPYGVLHSGENGMISSIEEKPSMSYFINTGMYVVNPECLQLIPANRTYHMTDLVDELMKQGKKVSMYPIREDSFLDMGEFEEMKRMEEKLEGID